MRRPSVLSVAGLAVGLSLSAAVPTWAQTPVDYRVLATNRTSTMEKELNAAADAGFQFKAVMGGETAVGGKEVVAVVARSNGTKPRYQYKLLAANRTSTLERELQQAADAGFNYIGQTVFESMFGGQEVVCILERDREDRTPVAYQYRLLASARTSTMQRELMAIGELGFEVVGMTVGKTALGGSEVVTITRKRR